MKITGRSKLLVPFLLLAPVGLVMLFFYLGGLVFLFIQSLQIYVPGRIVQSSASLTLENYIEYYGKNLVYYGFLWDTLRLTFIATAISVLIAYPLGFKIVRSKSARTRKVLLSVLIISFFVNSIVKAYAWVAVLGDAGLVNSVLIRLGFAETRFLGTDWAVLVGLIYELSPLAAMALVGPIKNVDPSLEESSMNLGATKTTTFFKVTFPLSMPGIIAGTLIVYAFGLSAFVVPIFLGRGVVLFMSNIVYLRFSETFNYPGGAALAMVLLVVTLIIAYGINKVMVKRLKGLR